MRSDLSQVGWCRIGKGLSNVRQHRHRNTRRGEPLCRRGQISRRHGGELRHMTDRHPTAPAVQICEPANLNEIEMGWIKAEIEMEIDIDIEAACQIENPPDLTVGILVHVRRATDDVGPLLKRLDHHLLATGIIEQAFLRKNA